MIASQKISIETAREFSKHTLYIKSLDIKTIVEKRKILNLKPLKVLDQILYAFIINYIDTIEDVKYLIKLIKKNINIDNFTGTLIIEGYNRYERLMENGNIKNSKGLEVFIQNILGDISIDLGIEDNERNKLLSIVSKSFNLN
jgi:hypothetical protein